MTTTEGICREPVDIGGLQRVPTLGWFILRAVDTVQRVNVYQRNKTGQDGLAFAPETRLKGVNLTMLGDDEEPISTDRYYRTVILQSGPGTSWSSFQVAVAHFAEQLQLAIVEARKEEEPKSFYLMVCRSTDCHTPVSEDLGFWNCPRHGLLETEDTIQVPRNPFAH